MTVRRKTYTFLAILVLVAVFGTEFYLNNKSKFKKQPEGLNKFVLQDVLPSSTTNVIVHHDYYSLSYSEDHEQAEWVAYYLAPNHIAVTNFERPYFEQDDKIKTESAHWRNFKNSGYDRGHLCPAADRSFRLEAFNETFLTSNISPQKHAFNAGIWNTLEQKTRYWALQHGGIYVFTGGILNNSAEFIGSEQVTVPKFFYKILFNNNLNPPQVIAFLLPHNNEYKALVEYVVSVDEIEALTGIDFLTNLDHELELQLEQSTSYKSWSFN